ncbi:uncharacterized protein [Panulirus ornatus]|uniref:uncharacterized protein isoform X2 n=1 Tax=Panulirus ornatus TaxID=150431 RepID=UPI003A868B10
MDASNEFKVYLSPSSGSSSKSKKGEGEGGSGVRQRLVPVINKVFSPSHFMLAQRKTTVYKAVSGVSFQDIDIGGKKKWSSNKREKKEKKQDKKDQIYTAASSEGERSLQSTRSDRSGLSGSSVKLLLGGKGESRGETRRLRHSLGSHAERPSTFLSDNVEKSSDKKTRMRSASRTRSVSATENLYLTQDGETSSENPPVKPQRSRSASRPRRPVTKVSMTHTAHTNTRETNGNSTENEKQEDPEKENGSQKNEGTSGGDEQKRDGKGTESKDCEMADEDAYERSRARRKSDWSGKPGNSREGNKSETDKKTKGGTKTVEDEEPEGGYFSLEKEEKGGGEIKFIYEALPTNACEEYMENDQCVEAIYVCQVLRKDPDNEADEDDHIYENYQVIRMTKDGKLITEDDENYENYQIIRRVKEEELLGVSSRTPDKQHQDEDAYESMNFVSENPLALTRMTATQARLKRQRPLGSIDSIPFIDDSDSSADETEKPGPKGSTSKNSITVITIKEDDNMEVTRKQSPLRTKPALLRSQDGTDEPSTKERDKCDGHSGPDREDGVESSTGSGETPQSSETSTPKRPTRHSYPAASPFIPRLCDKIGLRLARFSSVSEEAGGGGTAGVKGGEGKVDARVKKSMSHNDVQTHLKGTGPVHSESFSDDDIRHNEDFESFSETDSDLDNLDYDMFAPKGGRAAGTRSQLKNRNKPRGRSLSASHASPLMTSTPYGTNNDSEVFPAGGSGGPDGDLQSPKTFQDLLGDKHLNPPDTDVESQSGDGIKFDRLAPLMIQESSDASLRGSLDVVVRSPRAGVAAAEMGDRVVLDDAHSFTWSDAESEFEFIDFNKAEPPKTCVVYQGVAVSSTVSTATTTTTTTSVRTERKVGTSVKRAQSMKVVGERVSCRGEGSLRWEPLLCVLPEGLTAAHGGGLVRSVSGVSVRRSVRVEGSRYTATSADTPDAGLRSLLDSTGVVAGVQHAGRGSAPSSPQLAASRSAESTPSKFNIFSKFKGVKTSAKTTFKAEKVAKNGESTIDSSDGSLPLGRSHSHDNIQSPAYPTDRDALCSPLHYRSRGHQNQDETRRTENTLKIWIMEAKGIPNKKKYFCTIKVNSSLYGSTCSKQKSNMCFWGEYFELDLLPQDSTICIELMREPDKKSVNKKIGTVEIDLKASSPSRAALEEQWYPVKVDKQDRDVPALRIKHRFQSVDILPLPQYGPFRQYLKENATSLCQLLEPVVSVKAKEDIATTLVNIMQAEDRAIPFLVNLVFTDIQRMAENEHLLFRGNSVATKAIEAYMKLVGEQYLHDTLREPVQALITASEDLEVDPLRITNIQSLHSQRNALKERVSAIWEKILQSGRNFPVELRHVFHTLRERLSRQEKCELIDYLISSCVFLRFLCPAVLSPSLFNIIKEYPDERAGRNLTLVAKILQTLANFTHFQGKENFMEFLNDFIDKEQESCRTFLRTISSSLTEEDSTLEFDGKIDLGKHLALLHLHLADALAKLNTQGCESEASKVLALVDDVSTLLGRDYNETPIVSQPLSTHTLGCTPPLVSNPSLLTTPSHINNNYTREECVDGLVESPVSMGLVGGGGASLGIPSSTTLRSQSLPRAVTPVYSQHQLATGSPGANFSYRDKTAANDLSTNDEYVLITAFDHHTEPQNYMYPSVEANNNNTAPLTDVRLSNGNTYYMAEVAPPGSPLRQGGSPGPHHPEIVQQSHHGHLHIPHQSRLHPRTTTMSSRSHSVSGVPTPIERRGLYQDECSEFYSYMDSRSHQIHAICMDSENNIQGSQTSISQLSNIASSGYQSFAYSQSSSPVDSLLHTDNSSLLSRENGNPGPPGFRQVLHGSPLASPLHQPVASKHRAVAVHPAHLGHTGHVSLHGTPRHIPRVPQPKGSPNSSLSSSQSVEDLSSLRRGRTRQRRSASSSSDSSPDTRPASHTHAHSRRPHVHPPRTNPHCSPHLVPPSALRQEHRSRSRHDRSVSGRRGRNYREDFPRGTTHCYEDSEDDVSVVTRSSGGAGVGGWMKDGRHVNQDEYQLPHNVAPQQLLDQQEDQMRAIVERLMSMEQEFRHEQEVMRREMHDKDARIDAQAKKIAALDTANTHLIRTIASLSSRSGEMKSELPGDLNIDSCNASDTSDYKSSSC